MVNDCNFQRTLETLCLPSHLHEWHIFGRQQWLTVELSYVKKYPEFSKETAKLLRSWKTVQGHKKSSKEDVPYLNMRDMQCPYGSLQCHEKSMNLVRTFSCQRLIREPQN